MHVRENDTALRTQPSEKVARKYVVRGRVQGVGFRAFAEHVADSLGIRGWAGNREDGTVEVYAVGSPEQISEFSTYLWKGPRMSHVRNVEEIEAPVEELSDFRILF